MSIKAVTIRGRAMRWLTHKMMGVSVYAWIYVATCLAALIIGFLCRVGSQSGP
jgi:hypothetical protein